MAAQEKDRADPPELDEPMVTNHRSRLEVRELYSCTNLVARARQGLQRIAVQFRMDSEEEASVSQVFDAFLADKDRNLQLNASLDGERFL
jgi:hypothetical protein